MKPVFHWKLLAATLIMLVLSACETYPEPGSRFVMVVTSIPTERTQLQYRPGLSLGLLRGITRKDVEDERVWFAHCYNAVPQPLNHRRFGFVLLPPGTTIKPDEVIEVRAEEAVGGETPYSRFFGRFIEKAAANPFEYFDDGTWKHLFRCGPVGASGTMRVEAFSLLHTWDYDAAKAEEARNNHINDDELRQHRIVLGECSPGTDSWARWKVRLPPDLVVRPGDYLDVLAGSTEGTHSTGPISEAVCRVKPPDKRYFNKTQGSLTVQCDAPAIRLTNTP
ncbi:MAG TPA: hypothetical protein VMV35_11510 [Halothiobacillus sp.]|nr:hypothetical protein [Halothiobacillus sp.]